MATNFKNSAGTDLADIYESGSASITTGFKNSGATDLGSLFAPISSGSAAAAVNFFNSAGSDLSSLFCAKGTSKPTFSGFSCSQGSSLHYYSSYGCDPDNKASCRTYPINISASSSKAVTWKIYITGRYNTYFNGVGVNNMINTVDGDYCCDGADSCKFSHMKSSTTGTETNYNITVSTLYDSGCYATYIQLLSKTSSTSLPAQTLRYDGYGGIKVSVSAYSNGVEYSVGSTSL